MMNMMNRNLFNVLFFFFLFNVLIAQDSIKMGADSFYYTLSLEDNGNYNGFGLMKDDLDEHKVFIAGENHEFIRSNIDLKIKMFKYLHQHAGVNTFVLEQGFAWGYMFNEYVQTGDTTILNILLTYTWPPYEKLFTSFRDYNVSLPDDDKIKVIGIDVERFFGLAVRSLTFLMPDTVAPDEISLQVESLIGLAAYNDEYVEENGDETSYYFRGYSDYSSRNTVNGFLEHFRKFIDTYQEYIGDNFPVFERIASSLEAKSIYDDYLDMSMPNAYVFREQHMLKAFSEHIRTYPDDKYYFQFGRCHASLVNQDEACSWYEFNSIAHRMHNMADSNIKNKVCAIAAFYPNGSLSEEILAESEYMKDLIDLSNPDGLTIFKVNPDNALFTDYVGKFKYIIINNSRLESKKEILDDYINGDDDWTDTTEFFSYHLDIGYGTHRFNFQDLNDALNTNNIDGFQQDVNYMNFGITIITNNSVAFSEEFFYTPEIETQLSDSVSLYFSSYGYASYFGADIIRSKSIDVIPRWGFGMAEMRMKMKETDAVYDNGLFKEDIIYHYKNPAVYFDFSIDSRIKIKFISLGFKGGYVWDISNYKWRAGELLESSPKTGLNGFYVNGNFSVYLN